MEFIQALKAARRSERNVVIPDIKCRSPKEGDLMGRRTPAAVARALIAAGAPVLSVVTEEHHFGGSKALLREIAALGVPVLRKDFLKTRQEIRETKELGASAVLLMYACLDDETLAALYQEAKSIGLDVLVHIGVDTVRLHGEGFEPLVRQGQSVRAGTPLARVDLELLRSRGLPAITAVLVTNPEKIEDTDYRFGSTAGGKDAVMRFRIRKG